MNSAYYQNTGGMVTQFNRLDTITNNLANVNTHGYKKEDVVIGDFMRLYQQERDNLPLDNHTKDGAKFYNRTVDRVPQVVEGYRDHGLGSMRQTGNTLDFALTKKDHYFAVETPEGKKLTRDGSFTTNGDGVLVNKQGNPVLPANFDQNGQYINLPADQLVNIDKDGNIYTRAKGDTEADMNQIGSLMVVTHDNPKMLQKDGDNLLRVDNEDRLRIQEASGGVKQGMLEMSNVNAVMEMTGLIEAHRMVNMYQKVMQTHMNDLNQEAITKLAPIRA